MWNKLEQSVMILTMNPVFHRFNNTFRRPRLREENYYYIRNLGATTVMFDHQVRRDPDVRAPHLLVLHEPVRVELGRIRAPDLRHPVVRPDLGGERSALRHRDLIHDRTVRRRERLRER